MLLPHSIVSGRSVTSRIVTLALEDAALFLHRAAVAQHAEGQRSSRDKVEEAERCVN